jgi:hypothetical protein
VVPVNNGRDVARHHAKAFLLFFVLASILNGGLIHAADILIPPPEAPTTIFSTKLGSVDVDLSLLGSWTAGVSFGTGILLVPGLPVQLLDSFPAMDQGFVFNQTPDITISLELLKRFFLNVSLLGSFADNSMQLGYRGAPGEVLQSVVLGTQGITIPPSPLMQIPGQAFGSLGASAQFVAGGATNDLLLRWDPSERKTKTFVGTNELLEREIGIDTYTKGRYFFLPDIDLDTGSLQVFLEDSAGTYASIPLFSDGRKYRLATFDDVVLDSTNGLVSLRNAFKGRVLVFYKRGTVAVGNAAGTPGLPFVTPAGIRDTTAAPVTFSWVMPSYLGQSMGARRVTLPVGDCLLLWEPGDNSPFEIDNSYAFAAEPPSDVSKISYRFNAREASATLPGNLIFQSIPGEKRFAVLVDRNLSGTNRFKNFFPFENSYTDPDGLLYGPQRDSLSGTLPFDIFYQFLTPVTDFSIEANIVPGSVQVLVNGVNESRFEVEPVSGRLTLLTGVLPTDRIDITYSKTGQGIAGGDILFAWRDQIPLSDSIRLSFSAGIRWNANPWTFSQQPYAKSGTIIATAGIEGQGENLSYSAEAGVAYNNPDTTGILRLFGMEGNSTSIDLSEENAFPASTPDPSIPGLDQTERGLLYYRDYRIYGALGSTTLQSIDDPAPARTPYSNGSRMGPYNVKGSGGSLNSVSLVMEYVLDSDEWVGAQLPISSGSDVDLSTARAVTIRLRGLSLSGDVDVFLQIGSISEDLDSSGVLKAETSATDTGFAFVDKAHPGKTLKVGAGPQLLGNNRLDSEDRNSNSILDLEDPARVVTALTIASTSLDSSWKNFTFKLNDTDRQKLIQARGVRVIVQESNSATASGLILIDSIVIEGTPFWPQTTSPDTRDMVHVQEVSESLALVPPTGGNLKSAFGDTVKRFHPNDELNEVLETSWTGLTEPFMVQGFVAQGTGGIQYDTIVSYIRSPTPGATYTFSLMDNQTPSRGVSWSIAATDNKWHEIRVSRKDDAVLLDGDKVGTPLQFDSSYGSLARLEVRVSGVLASDPPPGSGVLYIDEIYCTDPAGSFGVAFVGNLSVKFPGTLVKAGEVPVLSNVAIRQDVSLVSAGFAPLYGIPSAAEDLTSRTQADADILFARTRVDVQMRESAGSFSASGGHRVTIPSVSSPVTVTDAFALNWSGGFSRENTLVFTPGSFLSVSLDASANADRDAGEGKGLLNQSWQASLGLTPFIPLTLSSSLTLSQAVSDYLLPLDWYGARWVREAGLLLPWDGGSDVLRNERLGFKAGIPASPVGFSLEAETNAERKAASTSTGLSQQNDLSLSLALLLKLAQGGSSDTNLSIAYKRLLSLTTSPMPGPRFSAETDELYSVLSSQAYMLTAFPFFELFSDNSGIILPEWQAAGASEGTYSPSVLLSFQRSFGARLLDLIVPSQVDVSMGQDLKRTMDLSQTTTYIRPKIVTRAVNLFGELGAYPLLPLVRTDEYSMSVSGSLDGGPGLPTRLTTLQAEAFATLTGASDNELTVVETLRRDQATTVSLSNDAQLLLDWKVRPPGGVMLPLIPEEIGKAGYFAHRESLEVTMGFQEEGAFHPFTLILGHSSTIVYDQHGTIKASASLGMDTENLGDTGIAWRFAVRAALEAKLTF